LHLDRRRDPDRLRGAPGDADHSSVRPVRREEDRPRMTSATYTTSYRAQTRLLRTRGMRIWLVVMLAALAYLPWVVQQRSIFGLPSLRIRGIYLLLSTMALHFVMVYLYIRYQYDYFGIGGIQFTYTSAFGLDLTTDIRWFYFLLVVAAIVLVCMKNVLRTRPGR